MDLKGSIKRLLLGSGRPIDASIYKLYEGAVLCVQEGVERENKLNTEISKLEKRIVELEAIKKALIAELPPIVKESDKPTRGKDPRWPNEPCGRSLEQCPYNKQEHIDYFRGLRNDK